MKCFTKITLIFIMLFSSYSFAEIAIVVNASNKTTLSNNDIKRAFMGKLKNIQMAIKF